MRVAPAREAPAPRRGGGCVSCVALGPTVDSDRPNPPGQPPRSSRFVRAPVGSAKGATGATRVPGVAHASLQKIAGGINQREEPGEARVMNRIVRPARQSKFFRELLRNVRGASDALSVGGERTRIRGISLQPYPPSSAPPPPFPILRLRRRRRRRVPRFSDRNYNRPVLVRYLRKAHKRPFVGEFPANFEK